ncbi:TIGR02281 family clan AA aspartic protease [Aquabacterium sp.]|uniref:retropepsin-like aspartic protease family protein n=1 Tax=Aquabacterium sp. TaxID=1872578 RepID=UPI003784CD62
MPAELPHTLKLTTVWLLLGTIVFLGFQWWLRNEQRSRFEVHGDVVQLQRGRDGHYHWPGQVNGRPVVFLVDTGATASALPAGLAEELALGSEGTVRTNTAGGTAQGQRVVADLTLEGGVKIERMRLLALPGLDDQPLLGMDVLGKLRWQHLDGVLRIDLRPAH